jgi:hypothetical protein
VSEALRLVLALAAAIAGMGWFALSLEAHWSQLPGTARRSARVVPGLRIAGAIALGVSLLLCLGVDHGSMAALVWGMSMTAGALVVAFTLAWRPRWLAPLVWPLLRAIRPSSAE